MCLLLLLFIMSLRLQVTPFPLQSHLNYVFDHHSEMPSLLSSYTRVFFDTPVCTQTTSHSISVTCDTLCDCSKLTVQYHLKLQQNYKCRSYAMYLFLVFNVCLLCCCRWNRHPQTGLLNQVKKT